MPISKFRKDCEALKSVQIKQMAKDKGCKVKHGKKIDMCRDLENAGYPNCKDNLPAEEQKASVPSKQQCSRPEFLKDLYIGFDSKFRISGNKVYYNNNYLPQTALLEFKRNCTGSAGRPPKGKGSQFVLDQFKEHLRLILDPSTKSTTLRKGSKGRAAKSTTEKTYPTVFTENCRAKDPKEFKGLNGQERAWLLMGLAKQGKNEATLLKIIGAAADTTNGELFRILVNADHKDLCNLLKVVKSVRKQDEITIREKWDEIAGSTPASPPASLRWTWTWSDGNIVPPPASPLRSAPPSPPSSPRRSAPPSPPSSPRRSPSPPASPEVIYEDGDEDEDEEYVVSDSDEEEFDF